MRVVPGNCLICLEDDDDDDIIELCEEGTFTTKSGAKKHHGVCKQCFPEYDRSTPWNCLACRRPYGQRYETYTGRWGEMTANPYAPNTGVYAPAWAFAPPATVVELSNMTRPRLNAMIAYPEDWEAGAPMDPSGEELSFEPAGSGGEFGLESLHNAMQRSRQLTPTSQPPAANSASFLPDNSEGFSFSRLRDAMRRQRH